MRTTRQHWTVSLSNATAGNTHERHMEGLAMSSLGLWGIGGWGARVYNNNSLAAVRDGQEVPAPDI